MEATHMYTIDELMSSYRVYVVFIGCHSNIAMI